MSIIFTLEIEESKFLSILDKGTLEELLEYLIQIFNNCVIYDRHIYNRHKFKQKYGQEFQSQEIVEYSLKKNNLNLVKDLIKHGAIHDMDLIYKTKNIDFISNFIDLNTLDLFEVTRNNNFNLLSCIPDVYKKINVIDAVGSSILIDAINYNYIEYAIKIIMDYDIDINIINKHGNDALTTLLILIEHKRFLNKEILYLLRILVNKHHEITFKCFYYTIECLKYNFIDSLIEITELYLLVNKTIPWNNKLNSSSNSIMHNILCIINNLTNSKIFDGYVKLLKLIINHIINNNISDNVIDDLTCPTNILQPIFFELCKTFPEYNEFKYFIYDEYIILLNSILNGPLNSDKKLNKKFDINTTDEQNNTALFYINNEDCCKYLLNNKIDVSIKNNNGHTAYMHFYNAIVSLNDTHNSNTTLSACILNKSYNKILKLLNPPPNEIITLNIAGLSKDELINLIVKNGYFASDIK